jgi:hypothetical protein
MAEPTTTRSNAVDPKPPAFEYELCEDKARLAKRVAKFWKLWKVRLNGELIVQFLARLRTGLFPSHFCLAQFAYEG